MPDLISWLRHRHLISLTQNEPEGGMYLAAMEQVIEASLLRGENAQLRKALSEIDRLALDGQNWSAAHAMDVLCKIRDAVRAALAPPEPRDD